MFQLYDLSFVNLDEIIYISKINYNYNCFNFKIIFKNGKEIENGILLGFDYNNNKMGTKEDYYSQLSFIEDIPDDVRNYSQVQYFIDNYYNLIRSLQRNIDEKVSQI